MRSQLPAVPAPWLLVLSRLQRICFYYLNHFKVTKPPHALRAAAGAPAAARARSSRRESNKLYIL